MITPLPKEIETLNQLVQNFFASPEREKESEDAIFWRALVKQMGAAGLLRRVTPSPSVRELCFLRYAIAQRSGLADLLFIMQGLGSHPIAIAGNDEQKRHYLDHVISGDAIAAFALTEPEAGSDAASLSTRAEKSAGAYFLRGKKTLISNAGLADFYTLFARTSDGPRGVTAFIVEAKDPGVRVTTMELSAVHPIGQVELKNCEIPENRRLGAEGEGLKIAYATLDVFRTTVAAAAAGMAERAFQEAVAYAKKRTQFGKPLAEFQGIQFKLAEMMQLLQASKLLIWDAATKKDSGMERITMESAIAKSFATEAAQQIIDQSLQIHGGIGLLKGSITERLYRDIRALRIYEGTTEILKSIIAQQILK
jgi:acyl-CoA dehydrogenase